MRVPLIRLALLASCVAGACSEDGMLAQGMNAAGAPAPVAEGSAGSGLGGSAGAQPAGAGVSGQAGASPAASSGEAGAPAAGSGGSGVAGATARVGAGAGAPAAGAGVAGMLAAGSGGAVAGGGGAAALEQITVWIAGDSTVANGTTPCPRGWGASFQMHFSDKVKVVNSAVGGRSVRTWLYDVQATMGSDGECLLARDASGEPTVQPRWQQMLDGMKHGDYLFIQFGINDSSATCDRHVGLEAFKDSYGMMAMAAKQRGAQAIFVTPVSSIACDGTKARGTRGGFVTATQQAATEYGVPSIDLHALSVGLYTSLGLCPIPGGGDVTATTSGKTGAFFCEDHTHFERSGADQIAELMVAALRDQNIELAAYLE